MNYKALLFSFVFIAAIVAGILLNRSCKSGHSKPKSEIVKAVRNDAKAILDTDSLQSCAKAKFRAAIDSVKSVNDKRYDLLLKNYKALENQSNAIKNRYRKSPTLANCDSTVNFQEKQIDSLKLAAKLLEDNQAKDRLKSSSYESEVEGKNVAIKQLSGNVEKAVKEIERRDNLKEPVKVFATGSVEKVPGNFNASIGGTLITPAGLLVGYQKGIIQNSHQVTAGFRISLKKDRLNGG